MVGRIRSRLLATTSLVLASLATAPAFAGNVLPTGGSVVPNSGNATISQPNATTLTITQTTSQAIINWNSFSVGRGDTVNFDQKLGASSSTLNRVNGSAGSWIAGTVTAPGTVLLVNPNGIAITKSGVVNTGGFAASTLDINDSDYLSGHYTFKGNGASAGVINNGHINVSDGGFAALLGGQVSNNGVIVARLGRVALGAGEMATLDLSGDGFLSVAVPSSQLGKLVSANGALVSNKGKILADGGMVYLSAATASNILRNAINSGGLIRANSVGMHDGKIVLNGGDGNVNVTGHIIANGGKHHNGGKVKILGDQITVSGVVSAKGENGGKIKILGTGDVVLTGTLMASGFAGQGGLIAMTGDTVSLVAATIDAWGATGGGDVDIGGGPHSTVKLADAQSVSMDAASSIDADARKNGNGGHIVIWSQGLTTAQGTLSAKGGANGGNGGLIETSGASVNFTGITIDASAAHGAGGTWLIDPTDLTIDANAANTILTALENGTNVTLQTNIDGTTSGPGNTSSGNGDIDIDASIADFYINQTSTLTLEAVNNINVNQSINLSNGNTLVMQAGGTVNINNDVTASKLTIGAVGDINVNGGVGDFGGATNLTAGGNITIATQSFGGVGNNEFGTGTTMTAGGSISIDGGTTIGGFTLSAYDNVTISGNLTNSNGGTVAVNADSIGTSAGTVSFTNGAQIVAGGATVNIFYHPASYASPTNYSGNVTGGSLTAYMLINNVSDLEAIDSNTSGTYALATDIDASGVNFTPIGLGSDQRTVAAFSGVFNGRDHVINNLNININGPTYAAGNNASAIGLFVQNTGTIENVGISGTVYDAFDTFVGGLVGRNGGTISNAFSTATVTGAESPIAAFGGDPEGAAVGGLVGLNAGTITGGSYTTGPVNSTAEAGGLVGYNTGLVENSYASGSVSGGYAGGLVGENGGGGLIGFTYALGSVQGSGYTGGLVGVEDWGGVGQSDYGSIYNSYAAGHLTGSTIGGLVGWLQYNLDSNSFHNENNQSAVVFYSLWDADTTGTTNKFGKSYFDNGWSSLQVQYVGYLSSTAPAGSADFYGNPYQQSSYGVFYDPELVSGSATLLDGTNVSWSNQTNDQTTFSAHWYMIQGSTLPFLTAEYSTTIQNAHQLQLIDMNGSANYTLARNISYTNDGMWTSAGFVPIAPFTQIDTAVPFYAGDLNGTSNILIATNYLFSTTSENFNGTLNGNGYTISNLYEGFSSPGVNAGLISNNYGTVENIGIANGSFTNGDGNAGSLVGYNQSSGYIYGAWATSTTTVSGSSSGAQIDVGGLVGGNVGNIQQSYSAATVYGVSQVGFSSTFNDWDGGLAGYNNGNIVNSYATGNVYGNGNIGGLVGQNYGTIADTYATGELFANYNYGIDSAGPLVGYSSVNIYNNYWNSDSWNATLSATGPHLANTLINTASGTGLSTAQMQDLNSFQTTYAGWDFEYVWAPPNQAGQGGLSTAYYPQLYADSYIAAVWPGATSMTYGSAVPTLTASIFGLRSYDPASTIAYSLTTSATSTSNVGQYAINASTSYPDETFNGEIPATAGQVSFSLLSPGLFSAFDNLFNVTIVVNGHSLTPCGIGAGACSSYSAFVSAFTSQLAGIGVTLTQNGSTYTMSAPNSLVVSNSDILGLTSGNYTFQNAPVSRDGTTYRVVEVPGTLSVTPAPLTITATSVDKTYGQTVVNGSTGYSVSGLVSGSDDSVTSVSFSSGGLAANATVDGGPYAITPSNAQGTGLSNYTITYVPGTLTIDPATLTYTANTAGMTYGGAVPTLSGTVTGFVNNETLASATTGTLGWGTNATSSSNVGGYSINGSGLTANHGDYTFVQAAGNATALTINPATLVVTPEAVLMTYSGVGLNNQAYSDNAANYSITGYVNGQNAKSAGLSFTGSMAFNNSTGTSVVNANTYSQTQGSLAMSSANNNYVMQFANSATAGSSPNNYVITPASYTAISGTKTYDGSVIFTGNEVTLTGITVNGVAQTFTVSSATANSANASSNTNGVGGPASFFTSVGTIAGNNGADPNNYTLNLGTIATNTATINTANYTSATGTKTYDGNATFGGAQMVLNGVNGETFTGTATANSANASSNTNGVGGPATYFTGITSISSTNGADPNNYTLNLGGLTTNQATINVASYTAIAGTKTYDGNANFAGGLVTLSGVNGETFNVAATANSANASSNTTGVGGPATTFVGTSGSITGIGAADPNNYGALNVASLTGTNNAATIDTANYATLTGTKTYDGNATFSGSQVVLTGVAGQLFTGTATANSANASSNTNGVGGPATDFTGITAINSTNGADPNNYTLNLAGLTSNQATINVANYSAIAGTKTYDGNANFGSGQVTLSGVNGETFNIAATANSANASSNTTGISGPATTFVSTSGSISGIGAADPNNYGGLNIASLTGTNNVATIDVAAYTAIAGTKTYDGNSNFASSLVTLTGVNGETFNVAATANSANASSNLVDPATSFIGTTGSITGIGAADPNNYGVLNIASLTGPNNAATITPASITVTALGGTSTYGQSPSNPGFSATGLQGGQTVSVLTGLSNSFGITNFTNVGSYTLSVAGKLTNGNYTITTRNTGTWVIDPATLTYTADPSTQTFGVAFPTFNGTVTGFVNGENLASATTGTAQFTSTATPQSAPGIYGIYGSGLTANYGNYVFVQAASNKTALTLNPAPSSRLVTPPTPPTPSNQVAINFSNPGSNIARVSFTPNGTTANNQDNSVSPSSLPPGDAFMHNHGLYFPPISQFDANQYSDFKLPPYDNDDSEATILTIIARGVAQAESAKYMIDGFWNGSEDTWPGATHVDLLGKASFSDGAGHNVTPTNDAAFPIVAGKTDFAALLMNGPVVIGGPAGATPPKWLLATSITPDGKGIICDDTQTGGLVELAYDPATKTIGGITGVFDAKTKGFIALADAGNDIPASDLSGLSGLQSFVPSTYYAVAVH